MHFRRAARMPDSGISSSGPIFIRPSFGGGDSGGASSDSNSASDLGGHRGPVAVSPTGSSAAPARPASASDLAQRQTPIPPVAEGTPSSTSSASPDGGGEAGDPLASSHDGGSGGGVLTDPTTTTTLLGFDNGLTGWTSSQSGGTPSDQGAVTLQGQAVELREGDSFLVTLEQEFTLPDDPVSLSFEYSALDFDPSNGDFVNDAFEVALVGEDGTTLVHTIADGRDTFFNAGEDSPVAVGQGTTHELLPTGGRVTVDLTGVHGNQQATLIFRLVNNDNAAGASDIDTTVTVSNVALTELVGDIPPVVTVELADDSAPVGPGSEPYRTDLLTSDPRIAGSVADDVDVTHLEVQVDGGPPIDITANILSGGRYKYDPGVLAPGPHTITVRATDTANQASEATQNFAINQPPIADAGLDRTINEGETILLDGSGSSDTEDALFGFRWSFADTTTANGLTTSRTFVQNGAFPVSLLVTDTAGERD